MNDLATPKRKRAIFVPKRGGVSNTWDRRAQNLEKRALQLAARIPFIYFFRCGQFVKVGWTTDAYSRLKTLQGGNPHEIEQAALMFGGELEEAALHRSLRHLHHRAEWFHNTAELAELIGIIGALPCYRAREAAEDWFLTKFGKWDLILPTKLFCHLENI